MKLSAPILIRTASNERETNILEVEHLIVELKTAGKEFQDRIHEDAPGGHRFKRIDILFARESRREICESWR